MLKAVFIVTGREEDSIDLGMPLQREEVTCHHFRRRGPQWQAVCPVQNRPVGHKQRRRLDPLGFGAKDMWTRLHLGLAAKWAIALPLRVGRDRLVAAVEGQQRIPTWRSKLP